MIEDILFLTLGFCVATVLALACLPLLWARALRLTRQRLELLVPWSKQEIDAERDGWRAQAAVQQRRLEQDAERSHRTLAAREIELGHRTASLSRTEMARDELEATRRGLMAELAAEARVLRDSEGQRGALEKALHDADRRIETDAVEARAQTHRFEVLSGVAEERRGTIAALETRVAGLRARVEDRDDTLAKRDATVSTQTATLAALTTDLEAARSACLALTTEKTALTLSLADERERAAERDGRLRERTDALAAAETRMAEQEATLKNKADELARLQRRFDALEHELSTWREAGDRDHDAALRGALAAIGDDTLRLLGPDPRPGVAAAPGELVKE